MSAAMENALKFHRSHPGVSEASVAVRFGVSRSTLGRRLHAPNTKKEKIIHNKHLTASEEKAVLRLY
jgi:lambda repressor-like predicted transcriptional regulator